MKSALENALFDPAINENWHMQFSERAALMYVLERAKPEVSIELGTYLGGSLRSIAAASHQVFTFDLDDRTLPGFPNVSFIAGNSAETLPPVIDELKVSAAEINFILIDGDHSEIGVRRDIENCLIYNPRRRPTFILMHDSSNPTVRKGILGAPWADNPHVHGLDLDFVPGMLYDREDIKGQIWGGLSLAVLLPEKRSSGHVAIHKPFEYSLSKLIESSIYV